MRHDLLSNKTPVRRGTQFPRVFRGRHAPREARRLEPRDELPSIDSDLRLRHDGLFGHRDAGGAVDGRFF